MFAVLSSLALVLGVEVESKRGDLGLTQIANYFLGKHAPVDIGAVAYSGGKITNIEVSNVHLGTNLTLGLGFAKLTKENSAKELFNLAFENGEGSLMNVSFDVDASLEMIVDGMTWNKKISTTAHNGNLSVTAFAPDRVGKIGHIGGLCSAKMSMGPVSGITDATLQTEIQTALAEHVNNVICYGGAKDLHYGLGGGIEGSLNKTANYYIDTVVNPDCGLDPKSPAARAKALTNTTNYLIHGFLKSLKIPYQSMGLFHLDDIKLEDVNIGEVQIYQTLIHPMMPEPSTNGTYVKTEISNISGTVKFVVNAGILGSAPGSMTLKGPKQKIGITFEKDKNGFPINPKPECTADFSVSVDVPSQDWNILWDGLLGTIDGTIQAAMMSQLCDAVKKTVNNEMATEYLKTGAEMWNNITNHTDDKIYFIDDNLFPWNANWSDSFINMTHKWNSPSKPKKGIMRRLQDLLL